MERTHRNRTTAVGRTELRHPEVLLFLVPLGIASLLVLYLVLNGYHRCLRFGVDFCISSKMYRSKALGFSFRYPADYPMSVATQPELDRKGWQGKWAEWVNFSETFYPNAGGERLGSVIVANDAPYTSVRDFAAKELIGYRVPPTVKYRSVGGEDAVCWDLAQQPSSFTPPSYDCAVIHGGKLYRIGFDYNSSYHHKTKEYYRVGRELILSTFSF